MTAASQRVGGPGGAEGLDVLIVSQPAEYGVAVCVRHLTQAAIAAGHRVVVACPDSTAGPLADWVREAGAVHAPLNLGRQPSISDLRGVVLLRRLARGRDVVHLHSSKAGAVGRMAVATMRRRSRPTAVLFTPHFWSWQVGGRLAMVYRLLERVLARRCDAMVAVSEQEAAEGRATLGSAGDRITVITNGVDRERFAPDRRPADRGGASPLVVCVGRLSPQKGQDLAIRALARLRHRDVRLRLVGDDHPGGEQQRLTELAEALGVAARIEWRGKVADTAPELCAADVVVAPSRWEGMSLVLLEAMACGAPLVAADVFGSHALGDAGIVVPVEDVDALRDALDTLLDDPGLRRRLGAAARERSAAYDLATTMERNLALWEELVGGREDDVVAAGGRGN